MLKDNHEKLYDILLTVKEDLGGIKSDVNGINTRLDTLNSQVQKHSSFIQVWKGKIAIIGTIMGSVSALIVAWIKEKL